MNKKPVARRLEDEQKFHNEIFESDKRSNEVGHFYSITRKINEKYESEIFDNPQGKRILEYGCGMSKGGRLKRLAKAGAFAYGIDISDYAIGHLSENAISEGLDIRYEVMNAEDMSFDDDYLDIIYGSGILHHLDLHNAFNSISGKLKKGGKAVFIEPLGHNPLINKFRNKTPDIRTDDEHPLLITDFDLAKKYFQNVDIRYFYLTTLIVPVLFKKNSPQILVTFFDKVDQAIFFLFPFMRKYAWQVLISFTGPK